MPTEQLVPDNGVVPERKKMVNLNLAFTCDTDEEALAVKAKVNAIVTEFPHIQVMFNITERPTA
jgi:hypothetical protein